MNKESKMKTAAVITISDKGSCGERVDKSGPTVVALLEESGWEVCYRNIIPDDREKISDELIYCADRWRISLIITTGGTGFSPRDITPEATLDIIEREVPGIPEAMRLASLKITPMGMLSRAVAGLRDISLIINLPGSEKAAKECLLAVISPLEHGIEILRGYVSECASIHTSNQKNDKRSR